ncbi:MAG: hypothetical protein ACJ754_24885 [Pyrinomonadaceae bacterium]
MHKRARSWSSWLASAILLLILGAGGATLVGSQQSRADSHSLKNAVSELKSQAGVGQLIAEQARDGRLTRNYVEAQAGQMLKGVEQTRDELSADEFEPELSAQVLQAADLARRLGGALNALKGAGDDTQAADSARKNLAGLSAELSEFEEGLKE